MLEREHPCKGCSKRKPGCQTNCEPLLTWLTKYHKLKQELKDLDGYARSKNRRMGWKKGYK